MSQLLDQVRSKWPILVCVWVSFVVGFGVSFISRSETPLTESRIQIADFGVAIPEGETIVTITSRQPENQQLGQLTIRRRGDIITGVPETERRIAPRERLSAEDATSSAGSRRSRFSF